MTFSIFPANFSPIERAVDPCLISSESLLTFVTLYGLGFARKFYARAEAQHVRDEVRHGCFAMQGGRWWCACVSDVLFVPGVVFLQQFKSFI